MKRAIIFTALFLSAISVFSQSNEEIDLFFSKDKADIATAAYFTLSAAGKPQPAPADATGYLNDNKWFRQELNGDEGLSAGSASLLIMKAFGQKGGIMYAIAPGPRYALKEMKYMKLMDQKTDPSKIMSGEDFMILLSEYLSWKEAN